MIVRWYSRPTSVGQGTVYSFQSLWDGLDDDARSWAAIQLTAAGWIQRDDLSSFYFLNALGEEDVETPNDMLWLADKILNEGFGFISHELAVPAVLQASPGDKRHIKQSQPGRPLSGTLIVFHWERSYSNLNRVKAAGEMREPTMDEIIADSESPPRYFFTAYRVPEGTSADRKNLRDLLASSGFEKRNNRLEWMAIEAGDEPALRLKLALKAAGVDAVHYHEIPAPLLVPVTTDGQL